MRFINHTKRTLWWGMLMMGRLCMGRGREHTWEISVQPFPQFCSEPESVLKNCLKGEKKGYAIKLQINHKRLRGTKWYRITSWRITWGFISYINNMHKIPSDVYAGFKCATFKALRLHQHTNSWRTIWWYDQNYKCTFLSIINSTLRNLFYRDTSSWGELFIMALMKLESWPSTSGEQTEPTTAPLTQRDPSNCRESAEALHVPLRAGRQLRGRDTAPSKRTRAGWGQTGCKHALCSKKSPRGKAPRGLGEGSLDRAVSSGFWTVWVNYPFN